RGSVWKSSFLERTWKSGSLEPRQHVPLIAASAPASPKGHPSPRCRGHEWPLFHAYASSCAPGAKKHPDRRKTRCGTDSCYPPLCLQHLEKQRYGEEQLCSAEVERRLCRAAVSC